MKKKFGRKEGLLYLKKYNPFLNELPELKENLIQLLEKTEDNEEKELINDLISKVDVFNYYLFNFLSTKFSLLEETDEFYIIDDEIELNDSMVEFTKELKMILKSESEGN
jgi:hypothetical protein